MTAKQRSTGGPPTKQVPVAQISLDEEGGAGQINSASGGPNISSMMAARLNGLKAKLYDQGNKQAHQDCVKTLFKILENLQLKPTDMKVRSLPKTNKSV